MASYLGHLLRRCGPLVPRTCLTHPGTSSSLQHVQPCSTTAASAPGSSEAQKKGAVRMSKSMKVYQERALAHDKFMADQTSEYEIGRRHLANLMGEDPETFTQEDVDAAIQYLLPSGLFEPRARPALRHPVDVFTKRKAAEFDMSGRPFHCLFYTGLPSYYQALQDLGKKVAQLDDFSHRMVRFNVKEIGDETFNPGSSEWLSKDELENMFLEKMHDWQYVFFLRSMTRLLQHPYSSRAQDFIMRFRKTIVSTQKTEDIPKLMFTGEGVPYMTGTGERKYSRATVTVYGRGSGKFDINGKDMRFFDLIQYREQTVFPLQFTDLLGKVDVVAKVDARGPSSASGAIRLGISRALQSFVDDNMREKMRLAGLLTRDTRTTERKKPGQKGARAKYTWKKR